MLDYRILDVFTDRPFAGNPLAVVLEAGDLTCAQMQTIAREFNLSETIFVRPPLDPGHSASVRIFLPQAEIAFAGHPTIGCAILLAETAMGPGDWETEVTLEEVAGLVPVRVVRRAGATAAEFAAPVIPAPVAASLPDPGRIAAALGLPADAIGLPGHAPGVFAGGPSFLFVPVADPEALAAARPQEPAFAALTAQAGTEKVYLYAPGHGADWQARMFAPAAGVPEDPATGSATAILAAALRAAGALPEGDSTFTLAQGVEMGRPSRLTLRVRVAGGALAAVHVGGSAVPVARGRIALP